MELCDSPVVSHGFADARRVMSECWIYTKARGLRAMTLHGNGSSMAVDGQHLFRWCILDEADASSIIAYLYSAERPTPELRERVIAQARARFSPTFPAPSAISSNNPRSEVGNPSPMIWR
jgi:hypothetical protein